MTYDKYKQADDLHGRQQDEGQDPDEAYEFWRELKTILTNETTK